MQFQSTGTSPETNAGAQYYVSDDVSQLNIPIIHKYLSEESYWSLGVPLETVKTSIENSLCFGVYRNADNEQVGFARIISDFATFAYLCDVFILEPHRGLGLSKLLMKAVTEHPKLQGLRRCMLGTRDAHSLYAEFGYTPLAKPERFMEKHNPSVYTSQFNSLNNPC